MPDCDGAGKAESSYPASKVGGEAERRYPVSEVTVSDEKSYPTSEVSGSSQEEIPHDSKHEARGGGMVGATPTPRQSPEAAGGEEQPHARGQAWWLGGPTPGQGAVAMLAQKGQEELSHVEGQEGQQ